MYIRYLENIDAIRKELKNINNDIDKSKIAFDSIKRILISSKSDKSTVSSIEKLLIMANEREERQKLTEHTLFLLNNSISGKEGQVINRMFSFAKHLLQETQNFSDNVYSVLADKANTLVKKEFKSKIKEIEKSLIQSFSLKPEKVDTTYYPVVEQNMIFVVAYCKITDVTTNQLFNNIYVIILNKQDKYFVRVVYSFINPLQLISNAGKEFKTVKECVNIVNHTLKLDKLIESRRLV